MSSSSFPETSKSCMLEVLNNSASFVDTLAEVHSALELESLVNEHFLEYLSCSGLKRQLLETRWNVGPLVKMEESLHRLFAPHHPPIDLWWYFDFAAPPAGPLLDKAKG